MIDINLIPENLKKKRKSHMLPAALNIPQEAIIGLVGGLFVLLLLVHVVLQLIIFVKFAQHARYKNRWEKLSPEKEKTDLIVSQLRSNQSKIKSIEEITTSKRVTWAQKLNDISDSIPRGVWLNKISVEDKVVVIEGSAVSKIKDEMISMVGLFAANLKEQKNFMMDLTNLEVGSIQRRKSQVAEVADFTITAKLK